jgi:hypothetical protein
VASSAGISFRIDSEQIRFVYRTERIASHELEGEKLIRKAVGELLIRFDCM